MAYINSETHKDCFQYVQFISLKRSHKIKDNGKKENINYKIKYGQWYLGSKRKDKEENHRETDG